MTQLKLQLKNNQNKNEDLIKFWIILTEIR